MRVRNDRIVELHNSAEIAGRVKALAAEISKAFIERELTVLCALDDCFVFLADLMRHLDLPLRTTYLRANSRSVGGVMDMSYSAELDIKRRDILLVEGVLDTGITQEYLLRHLAAHGAASVQVCTLVDKPDRRRVQLEATWKAFVETENDYVFGYGLGFQERWRQLPYLATFAP
jgi:hypoxanthine phosphoribosyltransferase